MLDRRLDDLCRFGLIDPAELVSQLEYMRSLLYRWGYMKDSALAAQAEIRAAVQISLSELTPSSMMLARQTVVRLANMEAELLAIRTEMTEVNEKVMSYYTQLAARAGPRGGGRYERVRSAAEVKEIIRQGCYFLVEPVLVMREQLDNVILTINELRGILDRYIQANQGRVY